MAGGGFGKNINMTPLEEVVEEEKTQNDSDEIQSEDESEEMGNEACVGEPVVTEMDPSDLSCQQKVQSYLVQSPRNSEENVEVIPTPPAVEEMQARFSKRTMGANVEHMGIRAEKMTKKRNLQGKEMSPRNYFEVLSNLEIVSTAAQMGVNIPDDNFASIDIIRELEISRANIAKMVDKSDEQQDKMLFITNAAGESSPLNTTWVGEGDLDENDFTVVRSKKKEKRKVNIIISKPVTRRQNQKLSGVADLQKPVMREVVKKGADMLKENAS
ncbi:hypothetical protein D1007_39158 [Hordeum vulgare]|nr:hypothetical protein D1007_39158 [Hordeum vulgare]